MIAIETLIARWIASRLQIRARALRRSLRDYQRREYAQIRVLERRSRGLRLYAAWVLKAKAISIREARWIARRLEIRAPALRRSLWDYRRREYAQIRVLERRSRGLRLYAAWVLKAKAISIREVPKRWQLPQATAGTFHDDMKAAA
jgi:predicted ArsR family transcriptional regulator